MTARQYGANDLADRVAQLPIRFPWSTRWANWRSVQPHRIAGRHGDAVNAVAVAELEGRPVVVSGGDDGTVRAWDLAHGTPVGKPLTAGRFLRSILDRLHRYRPGVSCLAIYNSEGCPVVVFGGGDGAVWVRQ